MFSSSPIDESVFVFLLLINKIAKSVCVWLNERMRLQRFFSSLIVVNHKTMQYMMRNALEWNSSIFSVLCIVCTVSWVCTLLTLKWFFHAFENTRLVHEYDPKSSITRLLWFLLCNGPSHIVLFKTDFHSRIPCDWCFYLYCVLKSEIPRHHKGTVSDKESVNIKHWTVNNSRSSSNIRVNLWMDWMDRCMLCVHLPCDLLLMLFRTLHWICDFRSNFSISCNKFNWLQNRKQSSNGNTTLS